MTQEGMNVRDFRTILSIDGPVRLDLASLLNDTTMDERPSVGIGMATELLWRFRSWSADGVSLTAI